MVRATLLPLLLFLPLPATAVAAQHPVAGTTLQRGVAAIRLRAMLAGRGAVRGAAVPIPLDPRAAGPVRLPDRTGRQLIIPLAPALELRAVILWWPSGPRGMAGLRYHY